MSLSENLLTAAPGADEAWVTRDRAGVGVRIRSYHPRDRERCAAVFDSNVPRAFHHEERAYFLQYVDALPGPFLVLERSAEIVACGGVAEERPGLYSLCWGVVREDLHGLGLGHVLMWARLRLLEEAGVEGTLRLETLPDTEGFFRKLGFRVVRREPDPGGADGALVEMERPFRGHDV